MSKTMLILGKNKEFLITFSLKYVIGFFSKDENDYITILAEHIEVIIPKNKVQMYRISFDNLHYKDKKFEMHLNGMKLPDYIEVRTTSMDNPVKSDISFNSYFFDTNKSMDKIKEFVKSNKKDDIIKMVDEAINKEENDNND